MKILKNLGKTLSREQLRNTLGGEVIASVCKATCNDGSVVSVSGCSDASVGCSGAGGSSECSCGHPGPLEPPKPERPN